MSWLGYPLIPGTLWSKGPLGYLKVLINKIVVNKKAVAFFSKILSGGDKNPRIFIYFSGWIDKTTVDFPTQLALSGYIQGLLLLNSGLFLCSFLGATLLVRVRKAFVRAYGWQYADCLRVGELYFSPTSYFSTQV